MSVHMTQYSSWSKEEEKGHGLLRQLLGWCKVIVVFAIILNILNRSYFCMNLIICKLSHLFSVIKPVSPQSH